MSASKVPAVIDIPKFSALIHARTLELANKLSINHSTNPEFARFNKLATSYLGEGKTLRALGVSVGACLASSESLQLPPTQLALNLGVAMEFYQASALIHDDLIDNVDTRRGHPTIQVAAKSYLPADAANATAVLVGDYLLSLTHAATAYALQETTSQLIATLHAYIAEITAEVAWGQYLDVLTETYSLTNPTALRQHVFEVINIKSGRYSVMHPLVLGALTAEASPDLVSALKLAGTAWGLAFQMRDDEIGVFGDAMLAGKSVNSDITEGKRTILLTLALEHANQKQHEELLTALGNPQATKQQIERFREIICETGAYATHEEMIAQKVEEGFAALEHLKINAVHQQLIRDFTGLLVNRKY